MPRQFDRFTLWRGANAQGMAALFLPDFLETVRRFKLWTDTLRKLDGRKSIYTVWQNVELVEIERDDTGDKVVPWRKVQFQEFTAVIGPDGQPASFRFDHLEDAVAELRRWLNLP